ncbi:Hypothetical predicted protein, partial [Podarcis lilfordi]
QFKFTKARNNFCGQEVQNLYGLSTLLDAAARGLRLQALACAEHMSPETLLSMHKP